ncbi:MAG: anaerobic carbon-monoxide dehydrogenase iron sulfur subunit [Candidatus Poribacteria bacterium]|nr:anaerobic carbon-monoxide dehydrogenase iron sulfur subunit [Candidatus Poribacteria bacterium]
MKKLTVKIERCSGCKRCEIACMSEHSDFGNYTLSTLSGPEPKTRIFVDSVSDRPVPVVCRHCKDALCVSACMAGCMQKDPETGIVSNQGHEQKCVGCWMCIMACPYGVISPSFDIVDLGRNDFALAIKCDFCPKRNTPACVEACPDYVLDVSEISE